jgi:hypothetical protein
MVVISFEDRIFRINSPMCQNSYRGRMDMKGYVTVPLFSLGVAAVLLLVSMPFSGSSTVYWNGGALCSRNSVWFSADVPV